MNKWDVIDQLGLELHPLEGGYFRRTYESEARVAEGDRRLLSSIYYLLTDDNSIGFLHKNTSDILHYFHCGDPITYCIVEPSGAMKNVVMGVDIMAGQVPQLLVKGGCWKASVLPAGEFGLISEAVSPGFEYRDNTLATIDVINADFPDLVTTLRPFIKQP